jgi:hypothetical protein
VSYEPCADCKKKIKMIQYRNIKKLIAKASWFCLLITGLKPGATILYPGLQSGNGSLPLPALAFNKSTSFNRLIAQNAQPKAF